MATLMQGHMVSHCGPMDARLHQLHYGLNHLRDPALLVASSPLGGSAVSGLPFMTYHQSHMAMSSWPYSTPPPAHTKGLHPSEPINKRSPQQTTTTGNLPWTGF